MLGPSSTGSQWPHYRNQLLYWLFRTAQDQRKAFWEPLKDLREEVEISVHSVPKTSMMRHVMVEKEK